MFLMLWLLVCATLIRIDTMIDQIKGLIIHKSLSHVVLMAGNIGFRINMSINGIESIQGKDKEIKLLTYLHVREDILDLYGFIDLDERETFHLLISISGIGPKLALTILSGIEPKKLKSRIIDGDVEALTRIPGVGGKTAKRIIVELKEKFIKSNEKSLGFDDLNNKNSKIYTDVINALTSLGYKKNQVQKVCSELENKGDLDGDLEVVIKKALSLLISK